MKARSDLIQMAVAILVPLTVSAGAGLPVPVDRECGPRIRGVESDARAIAPPAAAGS